MRPEGWQSVYIGGKFSWRGDNQPVFVCTDSPIWHKPSKIRTNGDDRMRIMGLDYGSKTVGVAVCDPLGITAQGIETVTRAEENKLRKTLARIESLIAEYQIETIVLGYPKNMDDSIGERAVKTEEFRDMLVRRTGLPVVLWDERLTTIEANEILIESGVRREDRKKVIDKIAATLILQSYLNSIS